MLQVKAALAICKIVPVITIKDIMHAVPLAQALKDGGITCIEITLRTPIALDAIRTIKASFPELQVGAGTVNNEVLLCAAQDAGADFGVSPGHTPALINAIALHKFPFIPGCATPSEAMFLSEAGFEIVKLFPAGAVGGLQLIKSLAGPLPHIQIMPTGGISMSDIPEYAKQPNVSAIGGSMIAPLELQVDGGFNKIRELAAQAAQLAK